MNKTSKLCRTASAFRVRAAGALAVLSLIAVLGGATTASADMSVAGVWFETDAMCTAQPSGTPGSLEVKASANAGGVYYMTYISEYLGNGKWAAWLSGNVWHDATSWTGTEDFHFNRYLHRYWRVMVHYAVKTAAGWQYGGEYLQHFTENNAITHWFMPQPEPTTYCYI